MKHILIIILTFLISKSMQAQLENVIIEKYYIADSTDASDTTNGFIEAGTTTYRIYVDLAPECKLSKLFGSEGYRLKISSTAPFFNNVNGATFGNDLSRANLRQNTVALDTWLAFGQSVKAGGTNYYFGIPKKQDTDGSFIGGSNNIDNLLINQDSAAGIPLTAADGAFKIVTTSSTVPPPIFNYGIKDFSTGDDSTIFGSIRPGYEFISRDAYITVASGDGIGGAIPAVNQLLIAQLTTKGKLSFELNLQLLDKDGKTITYVANGKDHIVTTPGNDSIVKYSPFLTYPGNCGCTDPHYLEYSNSFVCSDSQACKTRVVCGCTDHMACNYDSNANVNIPALCCYPGFCNNRDIDVVCPSIGSEINVQVYPNPADDQLTLQVTSTKDAEIKYVIYDSYGIAKMEKTKIGSSQTQLEVIDVSMLPTGLYWIRLSIDGKIISKSFMKK
jgi:hypothetical protein